MQNTFVQLAKNCKKDMSSFPVYKIAMLGDCSMEHLATAIKGHAYDFNLALEILDTGYNNILPCIMQADSNMYKFSPNAVLIYMCVEQLYIVWCATPENERITFAVSNFNNIQTIWAHISSQCVANIIQFTFAEYDDAVFGNRGCVQPEAFVYQLRKLNMLLIEGGPSYKNVFLVDLFGIQSRIGRDAMHDSKLYLASKIPIAISALPIIASSVVSILLALNGRVNKCIVLDLDNTIWGGVIGDDGLSGIEIGELGIGQAFSSLQLWLKELKNRGVLLAVCSKNNEDIAKKAFEKHNDMILALDDFAVFTANWEDKVTNIKRIQQTLNIGMDSIVFIDDSPFERSLVRSFLPDIIVPELPDDPAEYLNYLKKLNLFETISFSNEDKKRTEQYRAEAGRELLRIEYTDYDEYLKELKMTSCALPFDEYHVPRIAQLTQRSNQFNLRTVRYTESDIDIIKNDTELITFYFMLKDKLMDYGLVSVVILKNHGDGILFIDTWLMSCRVLKRGMEEFVINKVFETAKHHKYKKVVGEYIETQKNTMVKNIYEDLGFIRKKNNFFTANVAEYKYNKTFIKEYQNEEE
ncbi:MAG: HAD-IIIC family phosphatase [Defluviitaleaceae bacterium]|nr:HAD-IIIC family phosphatase [Defluviitaleaceae bacterium]